MSLFSELKRRNVFRVGIAYVLAAWVLLQIADFALDLIGAPNWIVQTIFLLAVIGLPLALVFAWVFEVTPEGIKRESEIDRSRSIAPVTGRKLDRAIIGILVVALGWFAWDKFASEPGETQPAVQSVDESDRKTASASAIEAPDDKTVAVLPFTTRSTSEEDQFFSDGMHDDLLTQLAKIGSLKVISRTSVMDYRDTTKNLRQIGRELGAAAILEGAVQRAGDQVRINVQLIDAESDEHLWAETYDRVLSVDNLFAMQTEMAKAIASALKATLSPAEEAAIEQQLTDNLEALEAYRRAKLLSRDFFADDLERAKSEVRHALELDVEFAEAWALLAYINMSQFWGIAQKDEYRVQALEAIERGREVDPNLTELDIMQGYYHYWGFLDYPAALQVLEPLLPDNRNNVELLQVTAWVNRRAGNWDKTLELLHQAERLTPRQLRLVYSIGETYALLQRWDRAQEYLEKTTALDPIHPRALQLQGDIVAGRDGDFVAGARYIGMAKQYQRFLGWQHLEMLLRVGDYPAALDAAAFLDSLEAFLDGAYRGIGEAEAHAYFGHADLARPLLEAATERLAQVEEDPDNAANLSFARCQVSSALGNKDQALEDCLSALEASPADAFDRPLRVFSIGTRMAGAGLDDEAMELLQSLAEPRIGYSRHWYLTDRRLEGLREHPDWPALMEALEPDK